MNVLLGAYVIGIVPALLLGGPLSDRFGRRPLLLPAPLIALAGSAVLAAAAGEPVLLFAGRVLSGVALGLVMAVGTAWIKELSEAPFDASASGSGARRAALSLTTGFALGAAVAAALAQFAPLPEVLPYLVNVALCAASFAFAGLVITFVVTAPFSWAPPSHVTLHFADGATLGATGEAGLTTAEGALQPGVTLTLVVTAVDDGRQPQRLTFEHDGQPWELSLHWS